MTPSPAGTAACGCRKPCHLVRPGCIHGSGRRAGPGAERAYGSVPQADVPARRAGSGAATGAVGLDYWITPGRAGGLGSSLGDHFGRLPACSLSAGLPDGAVPGPGVQGR